MVSTDSSIRFCHLLAVGVVGLCLTFTGSIAMGAEPPEDSAVQAESQQKPEVGGEDPAQDEEGEPKKPTTVFMTTVCPVMQFMNHGTYASYYAVIHPGCTEPVAFDGPPGLTSVCSGPSGCVDVAYAAIRPLSRPKGLGRHRTHPDTERDGVCPPTAEDIETEGVERLYEDIEHIKFPRSASGTGGGPMIRARVWFFKVEPTNRPAIYTGVGYTVDDGDAQREAANGEVVVAERSGGKNKRYSVLVLVDEATQTWRQCNILLLKDNVAEECD